VTFCFPGWQSLIVFLRTRPIAFVAAVLFFLTASNQVRAGYISTDHPSAEFEAALTDCKSIAANDAGVSLENSDPTSSDGQTSSGIFGGLFRVPVCLLQNPGGNRTPRNAGTNRGSAPPSGLCRAAIDAADVQPAFAQHSSKAEMISNPPVDSIFEPPRISG
jgi:hypothetical protein